MKDFGGKLAVLAPCALTLTLTLQSSTLHRRDLVFSYCIKEFNSVTVTAGD